MDLPFIPNLERLPYLLIRTKRTRRRTQAKPAKPTAMETWEKWSAASGSGDCDHIIHNPLQISDHLNTVNQFNPLDRDYCFLTDYSRLEKRLNTCLCWDVFQLTDCHLNMILIYRQTKTVSAILSKKKKVAAKITRLTPPHHHHRHHHVQQPFSRDYHWLVVIPKAFSIVA